MKSAGEWIESLNAQDGADANPCNIKPHEIEAIQADARIAGRIEGLREAANISRKWHDYDPLRSSEPVTNAIESAASELEKGQP